VLTRATGENEQSLECPVASVCDVCGKKPGFGHNVPWSKKKTNRRWNPNIQTVRTPAGGGTTRKLQVCTSCIKAGKVVRA
jgi:large subunit ribosomal protein L28